MFSSKCRGLAQTVSRCPGLRGLHLTQEVITEQLAVSRGHLTPELSLRLLTSECPGYSAPASAHPLASDHDNEMTPGGPSTGQEARSLPAPSSIIRGLSPAKLSSTSALGVELSASRPASVEPRRSLPMTLIKTRR